MSHLRYSIKHLSVRVKKNDWSVVDEVGHVGKQHDGYRYSSII